MSDWIELELAQPPDRAAGDSQLERVYHRYDRPLIGVIRQGGDQYLFTCLEGHVDPWHLWEYTLLESDDVDELDRVDQANDFYEMLDALRQDRPAAIAVAREGEGIVDFGFASGPEQVGGVIQSLVDRHRDDGLDVRELGWRVSDHAVQAANVKNVLTARTQAIGRTTRPADVLFWRPEEVRIAHKNITTSDLIIFLSESADSANDVATPPDQWRLEGLEELAS